jgi:glutamate-1-semialdehyde 2,1-aminomutase
MLIAPFNDLETVASLVREHKDELAGIIVEPLQRLIPPAPGFLQGLRKLTQENGILLIFDEVVTGFRFAYGGAQQHYGVVPDLCSLGKVIGGGFPLAAVAGRADIMAHFDKSKVGDDKFLMQVGTLSGNPIAAVAGLKTMEILRRPGAYEKIFATGRELMTSLDALLKRAGIPARVIGEPPLFDVFFMDGDIANYRDTLKADAEMGKRFTTLLRERGIFKGDSKYYVSLAHTAEDVALTKAAWESAIEVLKAERKKH